MLSWGIVVTHSRAGWLALMLGTGFLLLKKYAHFKKDFGGKFNFEIKINSE